MDYILPITSLLMIFLLSAYKWVRRMRKRTEGRVPIVSGGRKLSDNEMLYSDLHDLGICIVSNAIFIESNIQLTEDMLRKAAIMIRKRHPLLRMRIVDVIDSNGFVQKFFQPVEKEIIDVKTITADDWIEVHSDEMSMPFNAQKGPLWRMRLLNNHVSATTTDGVHTSILILTFHHSIIDGNTAMRFVDELLDGLNSVVDGKYYIPESLPLYPSMEDTIEIPDMRWWHILCHLIDMGKKSVFKSSNPYIDRFGLEIIRNPDVHPATKIIPIEFSKLETTLIKTYSTTHGATVNGVLLAAALIAMARIINGGKSGKDMNLKIGFPSNVRNMCMPHVDAKDMLGIYTFMDFMNTDVSCSIDDSSSFGSFASSLTKTTHAMIRRKDGQRILQFASMIYDLGISVKQLPADSFDAATVLSNLGNLQYLTKEKPRAFEITHSYRATSSDKGNVFSNYVATIHGRLCWTVAYETDVVSEEQAKTFGDMVVEILTNMCINNQH
uniref:Uncharacterized protein LOC100367622 n=1 Tax=Saccoglossus kowalevskii TaxID=10224 RepID=A0ABM0GSH9_SACKO|nr:PREDICTED: uncharacterized protein LOC100367622 [Saccoglossus kowalevskii]